MRELSSYVLEQRGPVSTRQNVWTDNAPHAATQSTRSWPTIHSCVIVVCQWCGMPGSDRLARMVASGASWRQRNWRKEMSSFACRNRKKEMSSFACRNRKKEMSSFACRNWSRQIWRSQCKTPPLYSICSLRTGSIMLQGDAPVWWCSAGYGFWQEPACVLPRRNQGGLLQLCSDDHPPCHCLVQGISQPSSSLDHLALWWHQPWLACRSPLHHDESRSSRHCWSGLFMWSDGCAAKYKCKGNFANLSMHAGHGNIEQN